MTRVAIVLPGQNYGVELPALAIPIDVLRRHGAQIVTVAYPPQPWPDWRRAESGDWQEVTAEIEPQIATALASAEHVTLIAKSMGTSVFGGIRHLFPAHCDAIWITPLFNDADVAANVISARFRSLSVYGTADPLHDPAGQARVTGAVGGSEFAIERADHRLVVDGDAAATARGFDDLRRAVEQFIDGPVE